MILNSKRFYIEIPETLRYNEIAERVILFPSYITGHLHKERAALPLWQRKKTATIGNTRKGITFDMSCE